jgi:hypothetical protein
MRITTRGSDWRKRRFSLGIDQKAAFPVFDDAIFQELLAGLATQTGVPLGELLASTAGRMGISEWFVAFHASRLLKYGLCEALDPCRHAEIVSQRAGVRNAIAPS